MRPLAVLAGDPWRRAWYDLPHAVRTGRSAFEHAYGASFHDWLAANGDAARRFDGAMRHTWEALAGDVLLAFDFSGFDRIVDVGGGSGSLLAAILGRNQLPSGVLLDVPAIAAEARERMSAAGLGARCQVVGGDFLTAVPGGGDLYILAFVLHNWDDERAIRILGNCRRAMTAGGRVLIVETIVPDDLRPSPAKIHDLEMLVFMPGGRERTRAEYGGLVEEAGLRLQRVIATRSSAGLIETIG
jgi:hypothetical protein